MVQTQYNVTGSTLHNPTQCLLKILLGLFVMVTAGCETPEAGDVTADLDYNYFTCEVQPVIARECSFPACHGNWQRPFRVLSPGKMRIAKEYEEARLTFSKEGAKAGEYAPLTAAEKLFNYEQALGFVSNSQPEVNSQLLTRPLAFLAGGTFHGIYGEHPLIGEIFANTQDPRCAAIQEWLAGANSPEECP